ncbi:DUF5343 domain-containing protein [Sphingomonas baiyangensis]|uniref:DUF5343 domain-containing protein n=1 Tax=Sphingomonas baiyangensis TaxID=2572576 RepID=A0A4U1L860_9SPHN|nr:DUF5343 domain-containing protein [Sphingomonas baiyangensis]TKD53137.1 hypothetical protein FBR43_02020 [Sphingomonas baiyangensis]
MAYPYIPSGGLIQTAFQQFRKSFPAKVDSETLKKLGIAPSNEGSMINIIKFLKFTDKDNQRTQEGSQLFNTHDDQKFGQALENSVRSSYSELFELHNDGAWTLDRDALISFFRNSDQTSAVTGARQALTFQTLASLAGKRAEQVSSRTPNARGGNIEKKTSPKNKTSNVEPKNLSSSSLDENNKSPVGLTVRIEINLPANGSQATYDNIFQSIRKNLLNDPA